MKVKRFVAANMQLALRKVSQELGADAVIMSSKKVEEGFEVVAALDYQPGLEAEGEDVSRQLELQKELEAAKAYRESRGSILATDDLGQDQQQRVEFAQRSDLNSTEGLEEVLRGLKTNQFDRSAADKTSAKSESANFDQQAFDARVEQSEARYNSAMHAMSGELKELKNWMVSHQGSAWDTSRPLTWQQSQLWQRCQDVGLEPAWADRVASQTDDGESLEDAWQQTLRRIASDLPIAPPELLEKGGRYALVGPTGAGKTTTIGKLAAQFVIHHGRDSVALITLDNYRVAAHDQISTFSRLLGVELHKVNDEKAFKNALLKTQNKKLVLVDSAGLASQDPHFQTQLSMLKKAGSGLKKLLVLPLTSQGRCLQENYEHFKAAGLVGCVFTKLDECFSLGPAMSVAALTKLPVTIVTDGPHIPDDVHYPDAVKLVQLAEQMARMARTRWQAADAMHLATQSRFQQGA
ncbi:MAG: flagellar biosynthesis protein FlhF [Saccharospirillaceae bacterium]|nr:hypothetical protein A3759_04450 [Thalassolituus sp. HI0120]MCH2041601.1 flagellar biosynthesis protein FlhF [Saccharospirillaceae bacterium]